MNFFNYLTILSLIFIPAPFFATSSSGSPKNSEEKSSRLTALLIKENDEQAAQEQLRQRATLLSVAQNNLQSSSHLDDDKDEKSFSPSVQNNTNNSGIIVPRSVSYAIGQRPAAPSLSPQEIRRQITREKSFQSERAASQNLMDYLKERSALAAKRVRAFTPTVIGGITKLSVLAIFLWSFSNAEHHHTQLLDLLDNQSPLLSAKERRAAYWHHKDQELISCIAAIACGMTLIFTRAWVSISFKSAIESGNLQRVRDFLSLNITISANTFGDLCLPSWKSSAYTGEVTPLMVAARHGQAEVAKFLLDNGADINHKDHAGRNAFDHAQFAPVESAELRKRKLAVRAAILEHKLQKKEQQRLRGLYEPSEILAAEAIEGLHTSKYGQSGIAQAREISKIVASYLTPEYVNIPRTRIPTQKTTA